LGPKIFNLIRSETRNKAMKNKSILGIIQRCEQTLLECLDELQGFFNNNPFTMTTRK